MSATDTNEATSAVTSDIVLNEIKHEEKASGAEKKSDDKLSEEEIKTLRQVFASPADKDKIIAYFNEFPDRLNKPVYYNNLIIQMLISNHDASLTNYMEQIKIMVEDCKVDLTAKNRAHEVQTPIQTALQNSDLDLIKYLIDKVGVDSIRSITQPADNLLIGITNKDNSDPTQLVKYLISLGLDPLKAIEDETGQNVLHCAAYKNRLWLIQNFIEDYKVPVNSTDKEGNTPLMVAAAQYHAYAVNKLLELGADKTIKNNKGEDASAACTNSTKKPWARKLHDKRRQQEEYDKQKAKIQQLLQQDKVTPLDLEKLYKNAEEAEKVFWGQVNQFVKDAENGKNPTFTPQVKKSVCCTIQ